MTEELSDFPAALRDETVYPWERDAEPLVWQWGADRGKLLSEIDSRELLRKRRWLVAHGGFPRLVAAVNQVLTDRQGE